MSLPVLASKLIPPRFVSQAAGVSAPVEIFARPGLLQRINSTSPGRAVLVYAPEGSGKTSLLTRWFKETGENASACVSAWLTRTCPTKQYPRCEARRILDNGRSSYEVTRARL